MIVIKDRTILLIFNSKVMKAIINLTQTMDMPCEITSVSEHEVSFKITEDIATADFLNALLLMKARIYEYTDYISVTLSRESVLSIHFVD